MTAPTLITLAALCTLLPAVAFGAEARAPSAAELKAFHAYYQQRFPNDHEAQPRFAITHAGPAAPWSVAASVESAPRRGLTPLCRMTRIDFSYDKAWLAADRPRQFVWLARGACVTPAAPVELMQRMPDSDVIALLAHAPALLPRARLIMAGSSACASQRSFPFALVALDVGNGGAGAGGEEMAGLIFRSDRNTTAQVWLRKSGADLDPWNVSCQPP